MKNIPRFHLAFPVSNLKKTKEFYTRILKCTIGRESNKWYTCKTNPDNNKCIKDKECIAPTNLQQSSDPAEQIPNCHMPVIAPEDKRFERRETTTSRGIVATYDPLGFEEERTSSCKETNLDRCTGGMGILGDENW